MKKIGVLLAIIAIVALVGCATGGGGAAAGGSGAAPFVVDLSTLTAVSTLPGDKVGEPYEGLKNINAFTKAWDDLLILFPENFVDISKYTRVTITAKYYNQAGEEIPQGDSVAIVSLLRNVEGDWRGPAQGPGPNTPLKEFNVGGFSGLVHKDRGVRHGCATPPQAVLFQNNNANTGFIELTGVIFHNGDYKSE
ncbi:MAG: hypothetical protein FWD22_02945 [Treponema sp.]|nr:hypothetical protein [Treponema sp.]